MAHHSDLSPSDIASIWSCVTSAVVALSRFWQSSEARRHMPDGIRIQRAQRFVHHEREGRRTMARPRARAGGRRRKTELPIEQLGEPANASLASSTGSDLGRLTTIETTERRYFAASHVRIERKSWNTKAMSRDEARFRVKSSARQQNSTRGRSSKPAIMRRVVVCRSRRTSTKESRLDGKVGLTATTTPNDLCRD